MAQCSAAAYGGAPHPGLAVGTEVGASLASTAAEARDRQRVRHAVNAQGAELRARADLNQAIVLFDRATGRTLDRHGVTIEEK